MACTSPTLCPLCRKFPYSLIRQKCCKAVRAVAMPLMMLPCELQWESVILFYLSTAIPRHNKIVVFGGWHINVTSFQRCYRKSSNLQRDYSLQTFFSIIRHYKVWPYFHDYRPNKAILKFPTNVCSTSACTARKRAPSVNWNLWLCYSVFRATCIKIFTHWSYIWQPNQAFKSYAWIMISQGLNQI